MAFAREEVIPFGEIWVRRPFNMIWIDNRILLTDSSTAVTISFRINWVAVRYLYRGDVISIDNFETSYYRTLIELLGGGLSTVYVNGIKASFEIRWVILRRVLAIRIESPVDINLRRNSQIEIRLIGV